MLRDPFFLRDEARQLIDRRVEDAEKHRLIRLIKAKGPLRQRSARLLIDFALRLDRQACQCRPWAGRLQGETD